MTPTRAELERLREKYRVLAELRAARDQAIAEGLDRFREADAKPRREAMRRLAAEFPGALRELDEGRPGEFEARVLAIDSALGGGAPAGWIVAAIRFHQALREALLLRAARLVLPVFWSPERLSPAEEQRLRTPPGGRLLDVVWQAVARELGLTPREAELLVYPRAPSRGVRM